MNEKTQKLSVIEIIAFGHKYGPAPDANVMLDVRTLKNPHYVDHLRPLTGVDEPVQRYIMENNPGAREALEHLVDFSLRGYLENGNDHSKVVFAFGCTGGKHRSRFCAVICAEVARRFVAEQQLDSVVTVVFRDDGRE